MYSIIALWSHPRSVSTAFERIMRERGDLTCFHEPFMYDYYVHRAVRSMPLFDVDPEHPVSYPAIRDMLLEKAQEGPIFFKDMAYYLVPQLFDDRAFAAAIRHTFLIRDPMKSILSYYRLDPTLTFEEIGVDAQATLADWVERELGQTPLVVEAEAVQADSRATLAAYWQALDLPFVGEAFDWDKSQTPGDWGQVAGWHGKVSASGGIMAESPEERTARRAAFDEIAKEAPHLVDYLEGHRPAYESLRARSLRPLPTP